MSRTRQSAEERRAAIVEAAVAEFAVGGLHGTSTHAIAKRAGISQPYVFQLFATKQELFLAACGASFDRIREAFRAAAAAGPDEPLKAMGDAYVALLEDRAALLVQLHAYAASSDPVVRDAVRERYGDLMQLVERLSGASPEEIRGFFGQGMLLNLVAALDLPRLADEQPWAARLLGAA